MKSSVIAVGALIVLIGPCLVCSADDVEKNPAAQEKSSIWMKKKLEFSQGILAGLTESDFDKVRTNAEAMNFLGYFEKWVRADKPNYKRQVSFFEFANQEVIRQAQERNLEGATLAYNQLVVSCMQCHKIVRDVQK